MPSAFFLALAHINHPLSDYYYRPLRVHSQLGICTN
nr:MAG TPA: UPF0363 protein [Caudoviricetes sp.]